MRLKAFLGAMLTFWFVLWLTPLIGFVQAVQADSATAATARPAAVAPDGDSDAESGSTAFKGKILSQNGVRYILRDEDKGVWYHLDDQKQAEKFLGKTVLVNGVLDGRTDMIRVRSITEDKS